MSDNSLIDGFRYSGGGQTPAHDLLLPPLLRQIDTHRDRYGRVFDLGCGNGFVASKVAARGVEVVGVDVSTAGIAQANQHYPDLSLGIGSAYDDLAAVHGQFPLVYSLEVIEHIYAPRTYSATLFDLVEPGGQAFISTPYHGYFKNLAIALGGTFDAHFTALWDHGHIKFWSIKTLGQLLKEAGFTDIRFETVGRVPALAKSMIAIATRPA